MKRKLQYRFIIFLLLFSSIDALAAVPNISYTPATNALTLGTAFTITPGNTGGAVSGTGYAPIATFASVAAPWDVTVDASGNVYTVSETGNTLIKITPTGTTTTLANNASGLNAPTGVAIDGVGNIYVSNFGTNTVLKFNTSGTLLGTITGFNQPYGISFDASNNAYVGDVGSGNVYKITAGTLTSTVFASGLTTPYGTAVDASGNVYVTEYTVNNDIIKINSSGVKQTPAFATGFNAPRQLGSDAAGNIYVADYGNNAIKMVSPAGVVTTIAAATGLTTPRSVQVDNAGSIYIADYGNNLIKKIAITGWTISAPLPAGLTFNTTTGVISGTPTATFATTTYTVIAYNASGKSNATTIKLSCTQTSVDWKGTTNGAWNTPTNWSSGVVPTAFTAVNIGVNNTFTNQPAISTAVTVSQVTFGKKTQAAMTIAANSSLTITDYLTINTGTTPTITGANATTSQLNLSSSSLVTITGTGTLTLTSPLSVTLQSDATGDATIGATVTGAIKGTAASSINVQRYLTGGSIAYRSYRLLSSPVYVGIDTHSNNVMGMNYLKNSIIITSTNASGGFDNTLAANPSVYLYRETLTSPIFTNYTGSNFRGINTINNTPAYMYTLDGDGSGFYIPVGNGFMSFFRGDKSATTYGAETVTTYVPQSATLTSTGTLNIGQITVKDWFNPTASTLSFTSGSPVAGFNLVGNPYASAIDWDLFQTTTTTSGIYGKNVSSAMYVLDPVTKNYGSYISGSGGVGSSTFVSNIISSGQGFFILTSANTAQLIFNESAKTNSQNTGITLLLDKQPLAAVNNQYLHLQMGQDDIISDQTLIRFNSQATSAYNPSFDALYITGFGAASVSTTSSDKVNLSINTVPLPQKQQRVIGVNVSAKTDGVYKMTLRDIAEIPKLFDVWLMDKYKTDSVNLRDNPAYSFNISKSDSASFGPKRFSLVIRQNPAYQYRLLSFSASKLPNVHQVQVTWNAENEQNYTNFAVERSIDNGKTFTILNSQVSIGQSKYSFLDSNPTTGTNMYRLMQQDINNTITYSNIIPVQISNTNNVLVKGNIDIYPNPAASIITLSIAAVNNSNASYNIMITNSTGMVIRQATTTQTSWQSGVSDLLPGTYILKVFNTKDNTLVGNTKFVKL